MKRLHLILLAGGLTVFAATWFIGRGISQSPTSPPSAAYSAGEISANGTVEGLTPEVSLRPEIVGTIGVIAFRENQQVKKGDVLVELVNDVQKHQYAAAKADWAQAVAELDRVRNGERKEKRASLAAQAVARKAAFEQANRIWERAQRLLKTASIPREDYENAEQNMLRTKGEWQAAEADHAFVEAPPRQDDYDAAVAKVEATKARWRLAGAELAKTQLRAPTDGCVLQVFAEPGDPAGPATSKPVVMFADLSKLRVRAFIEELDAPRLQVGQKATITVDGLPGKTFHGAVKLVMPRMGKRAPLTDNPGEYRDIYYREVLIDLDSSDGLVVGLRTLVRITRVE